MKKRSVTLKGHRTSISLEPEFWEALDAILKARNSSLQKLVETLDAERTGKNLSSALRLYILNQVKS